MHERQERVFKRMSKIDSLIPSLSNMTLLVSQVVKNWHFGLVTELFLHSFFLFIMFFSFLPSLSQLHPFFRHLFVFFPLMEDRSSVLYFPSKVPPSPLPCILTFSMSVCCSSYWVFKMRVIFFPYFCGCFLTASSFLNLFASPSLSFQTHPYPGSATWRHVSALDSDPAYTQSQTHTACLSFEPVFLVFLHHVSPSPWLTLFMHTH